jgi:hypothetical protein
MRRAILTLLMLLPLAAWAVNVRGRVDFVIPGGVIPMNQAFVELCFAPTGACLFYRTGYDGMYYFNAAPGPHFVRVNGQVRLQIFIPGVPQFDIPPVVGN